MPLVLMVTGATAAGQPITCVLHAMCCKPKGSQALRGKQIILPMLSLSLTVSNPPPSFKTPGLRNENGGWPLIIFRRQDLKVNHTQCNTQYTR